ncbi:MAG: DJ-1/PfpI/YhbO family deglycase/protease [Spirochaetes bacterium]|jgi:protease I|nr:DJ-1/PfpI/YhbO family deglycase/protease [Spirochaetota bacterium]
MDLNDKKALSLLHNDFEDLEFWYPSYRLQEAGMQVHVAAPEAGKTYTGKHGVPAEANLSFGDVDPSAYEVLLVPGGWAPDKLRRYSEVLDIVTSMHTAAKVIGEICHAGWVLISAGILSGRTVTSTPGIRDDMRNAGAIWVNEPVVTDGNLVSSRRPPDLPAYTKELIRVLSER